MKENLEVVDKKLGMTENDRIDSDKTNSKKTNSKKTNSKKTNSEKTNNNKIDIYTADNCAKEDDKTNIPIQDDNITTNDIAADDITANEKVFLGEEDYMDKMIYIVRPLLEKNRKADYFTSYDGTRIFYEYYEHPQEKAAIVMSHGFCEFTKKFEEVIFYFFRAGYSVYIPEHRGHGYSGRRVQDISKVHIHSYDEYVMDFHGFITNIVLKDRIPAKLVMYAHSMGGAIAALYLEQYPEVFSCAILSSPMLEIDFGKTPAAVVWLVMVFKKLANSNEEYVSGHKAFDGIPHFESSSCLSEVRYMDIFTKRSQDKNYQTYGASCAWTLASLRAVHKLQKNARLVKTPVLLFQAGKDTTVKPGGQKRFAEKSQNTKMAVIPDSKHEIYNGNDTARKEYYHKIFSFLKEQLLN